MASYPTSVKTFTTKNPGDKIASADVNDLQSEVNAIEAGLLNGTANLNSSASTLASLSVTGGSTLATLNVTGNSTLGSTITIGGVAYQFPAAAPASSGLGLVVASTGTPNVLAWGQVAQSTFATPTQFQNAVYLPTVTLQLTGSTAQANIAVPSSAVIVQINPNSTTVAISGITGGKHGRLLWLTNIDGGGVSMNIVHRTGSSADCQIVTGAGATKSVPQGGSVQLYYSTNSAFGSSNLWYLMST